MATKKTASPSGSAKTGAVKPKSAGARPKKPESKAAPVILDQPKSPKPEAQKSDVVTEAKAKEQEDPKPEHRLPQKPQTSNGARAFTGLMAGGAVAAVIGYFAAGYINPTQVVPDNSGELSALKAEYSAKLASLEAEIDTLKARPEPQENVNISPLQIALDQQTTRLDQTEAALAQAKIDIKSLRDQLELAAGLAGDGGEISAATAALIEKYGAEIAALTTKIETQVADNQALSDRLDEVSVLASEKLAEAQAKVEEISNEIATSVKSVDLTVAAERLKAAVETGKSYGEMLSKIATESEIDIPTALSEAAASGVKTLEQLRKDFPEAARRALKASIQTEAGSGITDKIGAYLKSQIGARSLEEREGDDPDAILSRVEGALSRGELAAAIEQAQQLPASGLEELADWLSAAETRLKVEKALDELSKAIDGSE